MKHFVIVHTDTCTSGNFKYVINTSINALSYRTEVFKDEVLIDAIEVNCGTGYSKTLNKQSFVDKYQQVHKENRDKYCHIEKTQVSQDKLTFETKHNIFFAFIKNQNILKKIMLWVVVSSIVLYLFITRILIYSDLYIDTFFPQKQDKIAYLEQVEIDTHRLESGCLLLSKKQLNTQNITTPKSCKKWCDKKIISQEKCDLFLAYFFTESDTPKTIENPNRVITSYNVFPKEDTFELNVSQIFKLKVHNKSNHQIFVKLKDIFLDNSTYSEIVQFEKAQISFLLEEEEEKIFHIFLEPSYYKQFELGRYTGSLLFDVKYQNKIIGHIKKQFSFMVKK